MKARQLQNILLMMFTICLLNMAILPAYASQQGTTGSELQIMEAERLELNLGTDWAGTEFQLKTDAGIYPDTVIVGTDGLLKMEIGGSSVYRLDLIQQVDTAAIQPEDSAAKEVKHDIQNTESDAEHGADDVAGIPVLHLILFSVGMVLACGSLIVLHTVKRRKETKSISDEDDE